MFSLINISSNKWYATVLIHTQYKSNTCNFVCDRKSVADLRKFLLLVPGSDFFREKLEEKQRAGDEKRPTLRCGWQHLSSNRSLRFL